MGLRRHPPIDLDSVLSWSTGYHLLLMSISERMILDIVNAAGSLLCDSKVI